MAVLKRIVSNVAVASTARRLEVLLYTLSGVWLLGSLMAAAFVALPLRELELAGAVVAAIIVAAAGATLFASWAELYGQRARDLRAEAIFETLQRGEAPPPYTVYLRPFASTGAFSQTFATAAIGPGALAGETTELEAQIERALRPLGPLVALGAPLEHIGAGRIKVADDAWQEAIKLLLSHARLIVMLPSSRAGTLHEIDMILSSDLIRRAVLIDPPNLGGSKLFNQAAEWSKVKEAFERHRFELPEDNKGGSLLFYGDGRAPRLSERLNIDADDRIERLFRRIIKMRDVAQA